MAAGGTGRAVFQNATEFNSTPQVSWMPDSRHMLFAETLPAKERQLYMADTRERPLLACAAARAPDGKSDGLAGWNARGLYVRSLGGGHRQRSFGRRPHTDLAGQFA